MSQRDLRMRSKEIMDAVEAGTTFTVTRDGREIATLAPISRKRTFVPVDDFLKAFANVPPIDPDKFRADLDAVIDPYFVDPYERLEKQGSYKRIDNPGGGEPH